MLVNVLTSKEVDLFGQMVLKSSVDLSWQGRPSLRDVERASVYSFATIGCFPVKTKEEWILVD